MLAICSDLDETPDAASYFTISRYLNTREKTAIGEGVGLEVGNTLFFDMAPGEFSYGHATEDEQARVHALIRSGHIDCLHSFGDLATTRAHAERALDVLNQHDCRIRCWVDHAVAPTNLGPDIMQGHGDDPDHAAYHTDLTVAQGLRYVWLGRVTSCMGQNVPYTPTTGLAAERSLKSVVNTARDGAKMLQAALGGAKYAMHRGNRLMRPYMLRDGQQVTEFIRCNPHPHGVSVGDHALGVGAALHQPALERLAERRGVAIVYTHLGKHVRAPELFPAETRQAFERLRSASLSGATLVASTVRVLDYVAARDSVEVSRSPGHVALALDEDLSPEGLAFRWCGAPPVVTVNGREVSTVTHTEDGHQWISIPWRHLTYPV